jgi:hypothetical protein
MLSHWNTNTSLRIVNKSISVYAVAIRAPTGNITITTIPTACTGIRTTKGF